MQQNGRRHEFWAFQISNAGLESRYSFMKCLGSGWFTLVRILAVVL